MLLFIYTQFKYVFFNLVGFDEYYRSHDHMGYIGPDRNATIAAASMHLPQSLFMPPLPPPQHLCHVSHIHVYSTIYSLVLYKY